MHDFFIDDPYEDDPYEDDPYQDDRHERRRLAANYAGMTDGELQKLAQSAE